MKKLKLPFDWPLYVSICGVDELNIDTKKLGVTFKFDTKDKICGMAEFIYNKSPKSSFFILWANNDHPEYKYYLMHEIHHIVTIYSNHLGICDEEFSAYLFENICKQLKIFEVCE